MCSAANGQFVVAARANNAAGQTAFAGLVRLNLPKRNNENTIRGAHRGGGHLAATPDLKLELADWRRTLGRCSAAGPVGPCAAVLAPDGSLIAAYVNTPTVKVIRVTDPANAGAVGGLEHDDG